MLSESSFWMVHYTQLDGELVYKIFRLSRHFQLNPLAHPLTKGTGDRLWGTCREVNETPLLETMPSFPANISPTGHDIPMPGQRQNHMIN